MGVTTVLVLPGGDARQRARLRSLLLADPSAQDLPAGSWVVREVAPVDGPGYSAVARTCAAITALEPTAPLVLAAAGSGAVDVPAVARAQAAAHRRVAEYVLVDPEPPTVTNSWPDAPVTVSFADGEDPSIAAFRLRGWTVLVGADPWTPAD